MSTLRGTVFRITFDPLVAGEVAGPGDATFRAGRRIVLGDGFSVTAGGRFRAVIDPSLR